MLQCVIVDDELYAINRLKECLSLFPNFEVQNTFLDSALALKSITEGELLDFVFLDVDMPGLNGLDLAASIRHKTKNLIIVTGHSKYGYNAFDLDCDGFLLKPFSNTRFSQLIDKLNQKMLTYASEVKKPFILVRSKDDRSTLHKIPCEEIVAFEAKQNHTLIHKLNTSIIVYRKLSEVASFLNGDQRFMQVQRSFIIAVKFIAQIKGLVIKMETGLTLTVGDHYRNDFEKFIELNSIKSNRNARIIETKNADVN